MKYLLKNKLLKFNSHFITNLSQTVQGLGLWTTSSTLRFVKDLTDYTYIRDASGNLIWSDNTSGEKTVTVTPGTRYYITNENYTNDSEIMGLDCGYSAAYVLHLFQFDTNIKNGSNLLNAWKTHEESRSKLSIDCDIISSNLLQADSLFCNNTINGNVNVDLPNCTTLDSIFCNTGITGWTYNLPKCTSILNAFASCDKITDMSIDNLPSLQYINMIFYDSSITKLTTFNVPSVTKCDWLCKNATSLVSIPSTISLPNAKDITQMFSGCTSLKNITDTFYAPLATNPTYLFQNCSSATSGTMANVNFEAATDTTMMMYGVGNCNFKGYDLYTYLADKTVTVTSYNQTFGNCYNADRYYLIPTTWGGLAS